MSTKVRSVGVLIATLAVGVVLGVLAAGAATQNRTRSIERVRQPGGFVSHMRDVIGPRDSAQWEALRPHLEAADESNREIRRLAYEQLRAEFDGLVEGIDGLLDEDQMNRLLEFRRQPPPRLERGRPPEGEGPPPPRP